MKQEIIVNERAAIAMFFYYALPNDRVCELGHVLCVWSVPIIQF